MQQLKLFNEASAPDDAEVRRLSPAVQSIARLAILNAIAAASDGIQTSTMILEELQSGSNEDDSHKLLRSHSQSIKTYADTLVMLLDKAELFGIDVGDDDNVIIYLPDNGRLRE